MNDSDTLTACDLTAGIHNHPAREDLEIQVHECEHKPGRYWASISPGPGAYARSGAAWASCSVFVGNVRSGDYTTPRDAYTAAVAHTHVLDAMIAAARDAFGGGQ